MPIELFWLLLPWSLAFIFLGRLRACPPLTRPVGGVKVSVIIPARNEQSRLPPLLASLREQDHDDYEVIVVDDNSTDATAALARAAGARTLSLGELPHGWLGKPHACWVGAQAASGDLLVFLDADTELEPAGLRRIAATHAARGGLVSVQPYHRMVAAYERLSSIFFVIMMASIRSFTLAGDALRANGSFGPCMVCSRADYFRTGGHRLVRAEIVDDVALAREMARRGVPTSNFIGTGTIAFRMYPDGVRDLADGWTKNLARGAMTTGPLMLLMTTYWIYGAVAAVDASLGWASQGLSAWVVAGLIAYAAYVAQLWWLLRRLGNFGLATALTYPVSLAFFVAVFFRSLYRTLVCNSVRWKGRSIAVRTPG
ncbi:glycosyltransferase [Marichromatium bheemlicum]|uniref:Glycosyltransferase n=1 Tax=Marichromatium bheemlicum TaxID=365339 RepID=A0ABX1I9K5_9GAMM|nr:glycosyltransferase [Marichromatium bheemlicum]